MKKYTFISLVGLGLLSGWLSSSSLVTHAATFGGGTGSSKDPYLIYTPNHLNELREAVDGGNSFYGVHFKQTDFIDFKDYDIDDDASNGNFAPIGGETTAFEGHYDGNFYTISNIKIISDDTYTGFFGKIKNFATIKNIAFENLMIQSSGKYTGGIVGYAEASTLTNISVKGSIQVSYNKDPYSGLTGGVVGSANGSSFKADSIYFSGDVTTNTSYTGGMFGSANYGSLNNLLVTGRIQSTQGCIGGILGLASETIKFSNSLALTELIGSSKGGIIGNTNQTSYFNNLYWDKPLSGATQGNGAGGTYYQSGMTGLTTSQLQGETAKTSLSGFDFNTIWETTNDYPRLKWLDNLKSLPPLESNEVLISGEVKPSLISLTVPSTPVQFIINPNSSDDQAFVAPSFDITNNTHLPLSLSIYSFNKLSGPFKDVLPTTHSDWKQLDKDSIYDFALGIEPQNGVGWQSLNEGIRYVADDSNYDLGTLSPNGTVTFNLTAKHGFLFPSAFTADYRLIFVIGI